MSDNIQNILNLDDSVKAVEITKKFKNLINKKNVVLTHSLKESLFLLLTVLKNKYIKEYNSDFVLTYNDNILKDLKEALSDFCIDNLIDNSCSIIKGYTNMENKICFEESFDVLRYCARICYSNYNGILSVPYKDDSRFLYNIIVMDYNSIHELSEYPNPESNEFFVGTLKYRHGSSLSLGYIILPEDFEFPEYLYPTELSKLADNYLTDYVYNENENKLNATTSSLLGALSMHVKLLCWTNNYITFIIPNDYKDKINIEKYEFNINIDNEENTCWTIDIPTKDNIQDIIKQFSIIEPLPKIVSDNQQNTGISNDVENIKNNVDNSFSNLT